MKRLDSGIFITPEPLAVHDQSYGIVVEGTYDVVVYEELVRKICAVDTEIIPRVAGGVSNLMKNFPALLRDLERIRQGRPVDKVLVIRDAGGRDPAAVEQQMAEKTRWQTFSFPGRVQHVAVRRTMETWLLADEEAVSSVALSKGGRRVARIQEALEDDIVDPKERFRRWLSEARLNYDPQVCREIARQVGLETIRYRCPSFRSFEQKVLDC